MSIMNIEWKELHIKNPTVLKPAIAYLHRSAQFPALVANSLLPKADDDSQTSLEWVPDLKSLVSKPINLDSPVRIGLHYEKYELHFLSETFQPLSILPLTGQTRSQVIGYLKQTVAKLGGDKNALKPIDHYELPPHETDDKGVYQVTNPEHHREMMRYRTNIRVILEALRPHFKNTSEIAVWPHHFDTGMIVKVATNDKKEVTKSIGLGLAIPDEISPEPYFYINHYWKGGKINYDDLTNLPGGGSWVGEENPMAILRMSQILKRDDVAQQKRQITHFFEEGINFSLELIKAAELKMESETTA